MIFLFYCLKGCIVSIEGNSGGKELRKEGVYSEGPRVVYNKLNSVSGPVNTPKKITSTPKAKELRLISNFLPSNPLRKHQCMARSLNQRKPNSISSSTAQSSANDDVSKEMAVGVVAKRSKPSLKPKKKNQATSISSAGAVLCCSPLNSSDIRNSNQLILKKYEDEVVSKVWNGALELGVKLGMEGEQSSGNKGVHPKKSEKCIFEIKENEKRDEEERARREHKLPCLK
ncbi:hypothetical protein P8452_13691 [Trifolium repens]|nr:hypothetical protein P8452_13691 [Trifolium repens]